MWFSDDQLEYHNVWINYWWLVLWQFQVQKEPIPAVPTGTHSFGSRPGTVTAVVTTGFLLLHDYRANYCVHNHIPLKEYRWWNRNINFSSAQLFFVRLTLNIGVFISGYKKMLHFGAVFRFSANNLKNVFTSLKKYFNS